MSKHTELELTEAVTKLTTAAVSEAKGELDKEYDRYMAGDVDDVKQANLDKVKFWEDEIQEAYTDEDTDIKLIWCATFYADNFM